MKILFTGTPTRVQALETYVHPDNIDKLVFWHQDTLDLTLFDELVSTHGRPDILISSAHPEYPTDIEHYYLADDLAQHALVFKNQNQIADYPTSYCFNFTINKNQINRDLLLKLVEYFDLKNYDYTRSDSDHTYIDTQVLADIDLLPIETISNKLVLKNHLLNSSIKIPTKFYTSTQAQIDNWNDFLGPIVSQSAVSLISESVCHDKIINFTEKTLYSVQGLTFPIWIGGYAAAHHWKRLGFDTFDDVVNHDYQYCETLLERCVRAFADNLPLLTNLDLAKKLREKNQARLLKNRQIMAATALNFYHTSFQNMPAGLQTAVLAMISQWSPMSLQNRILNTQLDLSNRPGQK
jgi:hypothetical protein